MLLTLAKTYAALVVYAITFSVADGMMVTSLIIECMESVEESKRASTFGFVLMNGGVFGLGSPPLAGTWAEFGREHSYSKTRKTDKGDVKGHQSIRKMPG